MLTSARLAALGILLLQRLQTQDYPYQVPAEQLLQMHALGRASVRVGTSNNLVLLRVTVTPEGFVESVTRLDGPAYALKKAAAAEKQLHFSPFTHNGRAVRATFEDSVNIYPEERWGNRQPFPAIRDWRTVTIRMERRDWCDQPRCISYTILITGEGKVLFTRTRWASPDPEGFQARLTREQVSRLIGEFRQADFFSMLDSYVYPGTDGTGTDLSISYDDHSKTIHDWAGLAAGAPTVLGLLENSVERVAVSNGWTYFRLPEYK